MSAVANGVGDWSVLAVDGTDALLDTNLVKNSNQLSRYCLPKPI
jgi:hypothetical protein